jgi:hypothetical protein
MAIAVLQAAAASPVFAAPPPPAPPADPRDVFTQLADEVAGRMLNDPSFQAKASTGAKVRIVLGDVRNDSDNEGVRVSDIFNEIRDKIVQAGTARLFSPGELNVDYIISPQLTSIRSSPDKSGRRHSCFTLGLTLTTASGENKAAYSAKQPCP